MRRRVTVTLAAIATLATLAIAYAAQATAATPTVEEMWAMIQAQEARIEAQAREIDALREELAQADSRIEETAVMAEATADLIDERASGTRAASAWTSNTTLGGYGEMHLNKLKNDRASGSDKDEIDFHRMVLFLNHRFSEDTRFYSELELEHSIAGDGEHGEYELEQAYIEHDLNERHRIKAGLFLLPIGLLNETHEPETFYGVERNAVESAILPTTWWEGGVGLAGELGNGFSYDVAVTSGLGLDTDAGKWKIRDGRQKVSEANASAAAYTGRLKYTGVPGLALATSIQYQGDLYQGTHDADVDAWLFESHIAWQRGPFAFRALWAGWRIDSAITDFAAGADRQEGWYVEPAWRISPEWGVFLRYSDWDNQAGAAVDSAYTEWNAGVNYWLLPNVVFKLDYRTQDAPAGADQFNGFDLGMGLSF